MGNHITSGLKWALESFQPWNGKSVSFWCQLLSFSDGCLKHWAEEQFAHLWALWGASHHQLAVLIIGRGQGDSTLLGLATPWSGPRWQMKKKLLHSPVCVPSHNPMHSCLLAAISYQAKGFVPIIQASMNLDGGEKIHLQFYWPLTEIKHFLPL